MAVGGNQKARQFFKQHGFDDLGSDKIETKVRVASGCVSFTSCYQVCVVHRMLVGVMLHVLVMGK
jgi:hypothetical protein